MLKMGSGGMSAYHRGCDCVRPPASAKQSKSSPDCFHLNPPALPLFPASSVPSAPTYQRTTFSVVSLKLPPTKTCPGPQQSWTAGYPVSRTGSPLYTHAHMTNLETPAVSETAWFPPWTLPCPLRWVFTLSSKLPPSPMLLEPALARELLSPPPHLVYLTGQIGSSSWAGVWRRLGTNNCLMEERRKRVGHQD